MSKILTSEIFISGPSHGFCNSTRIELDPCSLTLFKNFVLKFFLPIIKRGLISSIQFLDAGDHATNN